MHNDAYFHIGYIIKINFGAPQSNVQSTLFFRGRDFFHERIFFRGKTAKQYSFAEKNRERIFFRGKNRETIYLTAKECSFAKILFRGRFEYEMTAKEQGELYLIKSRLLLWLIYVYPA